MNRKISVILIMIIMTVSVLCGNMFINKVYADESDAVCKLHFSVAPSNPDRGDDILIKLSSTEIKKGIASVSFTLDFNADVFSISSATAATGWTLTKTENTLFLTTSDNEATTQTGDIASVILKVSDTAPYGNTILTFKSIQAADGDANSVDFTELNQTITITKRSSENPLIDVSGVFNSCDTSATNSFLISSNFTCSVISWITTITPVGLFISSLNGTKNKFIEP